MNKCKIMKNNKLVFANFNTNFNILNKNTIKNSENKFKKLLRRSSYRGVSKNGKNWQVSLKKNNINYYLGNYTSEENAAKIYDIFNIHLRGNKAVTNFFYDEDKIKQINNIISNKVDLLHIFYFYYLKIHI